MSWLSIGFASDVLVAIDLHRNTNTDWWFSLTVALIVLPALIINLFSAFWFHQDHVKYNRHQQVCLLLQSSTYRKSFSSKNLKCWVPSTV